MLPEVSSGRHKRYCFNACGKMGLHIIHLGTVDIYQLLLKGGNIMQIARNRKMT